MAPTRGLPVEAYSGLGLAPQSQEKQTPTFPGHYLPGYGSGLKEGNCYTLT